MESVVNEQVSQLEKEEKHVWNALALDRTGHPRLGRMTCPLWAE